ncbi:MAG: hypothetical protein IJ042_04410 [Butyricicoccus sp.]|nr:hypothetical protein [Butyricicoccus sp.]
MGTFSNNSLHITSTSVYKSLARYVRYQCDKTKIYPPDCAAQSIINPDWVGLIGMNGCSSDPERAIVQMAQCVDFYDAQHPVGETREYTGTVREYLTREIKNINFERKKRKKDLINVDQLTDDACVETFLELRGAGYFKNPPTIHGNVVTLYYRPIIAERFILTLHENDHVSHAEFMQMIREFFAHPLLQNHLTVAAAHHNTDSLHTHCLTCNATLDGHHKIGMNAAMRDELRRHWDHICVAHGCSIIADRHLCSPKTPQGCEHAAFVERVRAQGTVPVYENISYTVDDVEPVDENFADDLQPLNARQWREEVKNYRKKAQISRDDMFYWGSSMVKDADLLVYDHAIEAFDTNLNRIPENFLFLDWIRDVMYHEYAYLDRNRKKFAVQRAELEKYREKIEMINRTRDLIVTYNMREMGHAVECIQKLQSLMDDRAFQDDGERIEMQLNLLKMFVKLVENPMLLMRDLLKRSRDARLGKKPSLREKMAFAAATRSENKRNNSQEQKKNERER